MGDGNPSHALAGNRRLNEKGAMGALLRCNDRAAYLPATTRTISRHLFE